MLKRHDSASTLFYEKFQTIANGKQIFDFNKMKINFLNNYTTFCYLLSWLLEQAEKNFPPLRPEPSAL